MAACHMPFNNHLQGCPVTCQQEFELAAYQGDAAGQLAALRKCAALPSVAADTLLEMCEMSRGKEQLPPPAARHVAVRTRHSCSCGSVETSSLRLHHHCRPGTTARLECPSRSSCCEASSQASRWRW